MSLHHTVWAFAALSSLAQAHLKISSPVPYNEATLDNSPLVNTKPGSSGSNYPCKVTAGGSYTITTENEMNVGEDQTLSFIGSASHGGGTCQLALTTSREPGPTDEWKVFQIYEGGCPINGAGNDGTSNFTYSIPNSIKNGQYSFSWVWYNRIGNREIYMNCAPITVKGSSASDMSGYNALPNAYVINLPTSECSTVEGTNQEIPFVGSAEIKKDSTYPMAAASGPSCAASAAAMTQAGAGSGTAAASATSAPSSTAAGGSSGAASVAASASSTGVYSAPASSAAAPASASGGYGAGSAISSGFVTMSTATGAGATSAYAVPSSAPTASYGGNSSTSPSSSSSSSNSNSDGITCNAAGTQYGQVVAGTTVWRPVAAGTKCQNGAIVKRFANPHARRSGSVFA